MTLENLSTLSVGEALDHDNFLIFILINLCWYRIRFDLQ